MTSKIYIAITIIYIIIKYIRDIILLHQVTKIGYKFNNPKKHINKFFRNLLTLFIPFIRTILIIKKTIVLFNLNKYVSKLKDIDNELIILSEKEKMNLKNNYSLFHILSINLHTEIKPNSLIVYMDNNEENIIYYSILNNKKIIVSSKGPVSKLSKKKQLQKLEEQLYEVDIIKNINSSKANASFNKNKLFNNQTNSNLYFNSINNFN